MKKWLLTAVLFTPALLQAKAVEITGTVPVAVEQYAAKGLQATPPKIVLLQKIKLSKHAQVNLANRIKAPLFKATPDDGNQFPPSLNIGMNNTPVLDQGAHGSCVTFANTAALDAIIGQGDYISQLCSLELGSYLYNNKLSEVSGWEGASGPIVLDQLQKYGLISTEFQRTIGCAGVKAYPTYDAYSSGHEMSIEDYTANSTPLNQYANWESLVDFDSSFSDDYDPRLTLQMVKEHLNNNERLTFGVMLDPKVGHVGALGKNVKANDTWMLTPAIISDFFRGEIKAGHEMVIYGYDDDVVVKDSNGYKEKGILRLRNSWSNAAGDQGDYYMTYKYFKLLTIELQLLKAAQ